MPTWCIHTHTPKYPLVKKDIKTFRAKIRIHSTLPLPVIIIIKLNRIRVIEEEMKDDDPSTKKVTIEVQRFHLPRE